MKQVGNTILAKGVNHILAKRDNSAWPKGAKLSGFSNPYRMNNNAGNETGKWNMAAGDIREFLLVWDGSSGYYAYLLNIRE